MNRTRIYWIVAVLELVAGLLSPVVAVPLCLSLSGPGSDPADTLLGKGLAATVGLILGLFAGLAFLASAVLCVPIARGRAQRWKRAMWIATGSGVTILVLGLTLVAVLFDSSS